MNIILKGIDMPSKGEDVTIEITSNGYVRAYSTVPMVYDHDIQAIQIPYDVEDIVDDVVENHELHKKGGWII